MTFTPDSIGRLAKASPREVRGITEQRARVKLRRARMSACLTQLQLAHKLDVSVSSVEDWERGACRIPAWVVDATEGLAQMRKAGGM